MGIKINGKEFGYNLDIRLGILELMDRAEDLGVKEIKLVIKEVLIPRPTNKEYFNFKRSDTERIMKGFTEEMKRESAELKKKLSK